MALSFFSSSSCATILLTASLMMERYRSKGFPCCGGIRIGGWRRYSLISSKAFDIHHFMCVVHSSLGFKDGLVSGGELGNESSNVL